MTQFYYTFPPSPDGLPQAPGEEKPLSFPRTEGVRATQGQCHSHRHGGRHVPAECIFKFQDFFSKSETSSLAHEEDAQGQEGIN